MPGHHCAKYSYTSFLFASPLSEIELSRGHKVLLFFSDRDPGMLIDGENIVIVGDYPTVVSNFSVLVLDKNGVELNNHQFNLDEGDVVDVVKSATGNYIGGITTTNGLGMIVCLNPGGSPGDNGDCIDISKPGIFVSDDMLVSTVGDSYQWYKDGELMVGETERELQIDLLDAAIYKVKVTIGNCALFSDDYFNLITAISPEKAHSISVYPNPVRGDIVIRSTTDLHDVNLELYSPQGTLVNAPGASTGFTATIPGAGLTPGVYFLRAKSSYGTEIIRILKTH